MLPPCIWYLYGHPLPSCSHPAAPKLKSIVLCVGGVSCEFVQKTALLRAGMSCLSGSVTSLGPFAAGSRLGSNSKPLFQKPVLVSDMQSDSW